MANTIISKIVTAGATLLLSVYKASIKVKTLRGLNKKPSRSQEIATPTTPTKNPHAHLFVGCGGFLE